MKIRNLLAVTAALTLPLAALAEGDSPWLPIPGQFSLSVNQTEQSARDAYIGAQKLSVSAITGGAASRFKRSTTNLYASYGLADSVSLDAKLGYGKARAGAADADSGMTDTIIGVNWRVLDEFERPTLPTLTLRGAAIIRGNYDGGRLAALGNGENGFELAALLGRQMTPALALWAELGVQDRSGDVPNATFYEVGARYRFAPHWSASLGYTSKKYGGDLDLAGPGFTPARFQEVRAERALVKLGLAYAFAGNQGVALNLASVVSARNENKDDAIVGLSYTYAF